MEARSTAEIESRIKHILISDLEIELDRLATYDSNTPLLGRGIGLDSVETLTLAASIEREFGIEIEDAELTPDIFETIGSLVAYVFQKRSKEKLF
jgi:acyl carrier protein